MASRMSLPSPWSHIVPERLDTTRLACDDQSRKEEADREDDQSEDHAPDDHEAEAAACNGGDDDPDNRCEDSSDCVGVRPSVHSHVLGRYYCVAGQADVLKVEARGIDFYAGIEASWSPETGTELPLGPVLARAAAKRLASMTDRNSWAMLCPRGRIAGRRPGLRPTPSLLSRAGGSSVRTDGTEGELTDR
jgi:hypothetical protein